MSGAPANIHATALIAGDRGILIRGPSGSGKTTLALTLITQAALAGRFAALIADDQSFVEARHGRVLAQAPSSIEGLAEVYGLGPHRVASRRAGLIDLVVDLVARETAPRFQELGATSIAGATLPSLILAERETQSATRVLVAWLGWSPFAK